MSSEPRAGFSSIPTAVLDNEDLSVHAKMVLLALSSYAGCKQITPSHKTLARLTSVSERTVRTALADLAEAELVEWSTEVTTRGSVNVYRLLSPWTGGAASGAVPPQDEEGGSGKRRRRGTAPGAGEVDSSEVDKEQIHVEDALIGVPPAPFAPFSDPVDQAFEEFWEAYPKGRRVSSKAKNLAKFRTAVKNGADPQVIVDAIKARAAWYIQEGTQPQHQKTSMPWLNGEHWCDEVVGLRAKVAPRETYAYTEGIVREPTW